MEPRQPGNKNLPDFNQLTDRLIVEKPSEPMLVIKTNLDAENVTEHNPYCQGKTAKNPKEFKNYFEE